MKKILLISIISLFLFSCSKETPKRGNTETIGGNDYVMPMCSSNPSEVIKYYKEIGATVANKQEGSNVLVNVKFESAPDVLVKEINYEFFDMGNMGYDMKYTYDPAVEVTKDMKVELIKSLNAQTLNK